MNITPGLKLKGPMVQTASKRSMNEEGGKSAEDVWNPRVAGEFLTGGLFYTGLKSIAKVSERIYGTKNFRKVSMEKPVLLVQGYGVEPGQFLMTMEHLTQDGQNGGAPVYVKDGAFFSNPECTEPSEPTSDAKVFRLIHDAYTPPEQVADKMELATSAIAKLTGEDRPDVMAHSMGGISARIFADRGHKIGKLALLGTPNQGSRAALLTKSALVNGVGWAMSLAGAGPAALPSLEWMVPTMNGNEKLESLNERTMEQKAGTEGMIVIGVDGFMSPSSVKATEPGDGLIGASCFKLDNVDLKLLSGGTRKVHSQMITDPDVFQEYSDFFGWKPS